MLRTLALALTVAMITAVLATVVPPVPPVSRRERQMSDDERSDRAKGSSLRSTTIIDGNEIGV